MRGTSESVDVSDILTLHSKLIYCYIFTQAGLKIKFLLNTNLLSHLINTNIALVKVGLKTKLCLENQRIEPWDSTAQTDCLAVASKNCCKRTVAYQVQVADKGLVNNQAYLVLNKMLQYLGSNDDLYLNMNPKPTFVVQLLIKLFL